MTVDDLWSVQRSEWLLLLDAAEARLRHCLVQLNDVQIWWRPFDGGNSIANQLLHVCGNLQQWCVDGVLNRQSDRDRAAEFSAVGGFGCDELLQRLAMTLDDIRAVLRQLCSNDITKHRDIQGFAVTVAGALSHSIPHLVGHTHQIMLLTRMQLGDRYQFHWLPDGDRSTVPL